MKKPVIFVLIAVVLAGAVWFASTKNFFRKEVAQPVKIGILFKGNNFKQVADGFVAGFNENLPKGHQVEFVIKNETGSEQKDFDASAQGLVDNGVNLIVAIGVEPVKAAKKVTAENKIPVILELGVNPETQGFVQSFQRPGGNLTGISWQVEELTGKRLEFLKMVDPQVKRITIFRRKGADIMSMSLGHLTPVAEKLGVSVAIKEFSTLEELQAAVLATTAADTDAFFYASDPFVQRNGEFIIKHALEEKIAVMFHDEYFAKLGATASYGANFPDAGKQGARLASKILFEGQSPAELPIETVSKIDFAINLASAKAIGISVPDEALSLAQVVINK